MSERTLVFDPHYPGRWGKQTLDILSDVVNYDHIAFPYTYNWLRVTQEDQFINKLLHMSGITLGANRVGIKGPQYWSDDPGNVDWESMLLVELGRPLSARAWSYLSGSGSFDTLTEEDHQDFLTLATQLIPSRVAVLGETWQTTITFIIGGQPYERVKTFLDYVLDGNAPDSGLVVFLDL